MSSATRRSRRTTIAFVKGQSASKIISRCAKTFSSASYMCVEGRRNKKKYKDVGSSMGRFRRLGCKLSGKPFSDKFFKQCDTVGKTRKIYTPCILVLKPLLEFLKSNQM